MLRRVSIRNVCFLGAMWLGLAPTPSSGTSFVMVEDGDLVDQAPLIVEASVLAVDPSPGTVQPLTEYLMQIDRTLRGGVAGSTLRVRVQGGVLGDGMALHIDGAPQFIKGERLVLFLVPHSEGTFQILHFFLGAFRILDLGGTEVAVRNLEGTREILIPGRAAPQRGLRQLDRFRLWIESRSLGFERPVDYFVAGGEDFPEKYTLLVGGAGLPFRWREFDEEDSVGFRAHAGGQPGLSEGGFDEFQVALAAWTNSPSRPVDYRYFGTMASVGGGFNSFDGINAILFDDLAVPSAFSAPFSCASGGVIARGGPWSSSGNTHDSHGQTYLTILGADIVTNKGIACLMGIAGAGEEIFAHELGHTLGLGHSCGDAASGSCEPDSVFDEALMRANFHGDGRGARLNSDDHEGILFVYPNEPGLFFFDGFESGDTEGWSSAFP